MPGFAKLRPLRDFVHATRHGRDLSLDPEITGTPILRIDAGTMPRLDGGRYRFRTCDPYHVKVVLYH